MLRYIGIRVFSRSFHNTKNLCLKEISCVEDGKTTIIEGKYVESPRLPYLVEVSGEKKKACPVCRLGLDVKHTDVLILSQFVRTDGCMLPRRITGLCSMQQKRIGTMVSMAHKAGLLRGLVPTNSRDDPSRREKWKKYNTYYDEDTIKFVHWTKKEPTN